MACTWAYMRRCYSSIHYWQFIALLAASVLWFHASCHIDHGWAHAGLSLQVLGTPTREELMAMNPNYTEFKFPQIKAHPWHKARLHVRRYLRCHQDIPSQAHSGFLST
eukprot:807228-Amphidinium_carterae.1